jgi:hypothetical protein
LTGSSDREKHFAWRPVGAAKKHQVWYHHLSGSGLTWQAVPGLALLAVIANGLYCTACVVDIFVQMSEYQPAWKRHRRLVLAAGTMLAMAVFCPTRD